MSAALRPFGLGYQNVKSRTKKSIIECQAQAPNHDVHCVGADVFADMATTA
jgi:hypothetical protein